MSSINRFRKPGGLIQLVHLLETSDKAKRDELMLIVAQEDPGWAFFVQSKALNIERILSWPPQVLELIFVRLPLPFIAILSQMSEPEIQKKIENSINRSLIRELFQLRDEKVYSSEHHWNVVIKVIQTVRELQSQGLLKFSTFDPGLEIDSRLAG